MKTEDGDVFYIEIFDRKKEMNKVWGKCLAAHSTEEPYTIAFSKDIVTPGLIAHEVLHLFFSLNCKRGETVTFDEEAVADFVCGITDSVLNQLQAIS